MKLSRADVEVCLDGREQLVDEFLRHRIRRVLFPNYSPCVCAFQGTIEVFANQEFDH
ncbi:unnamed protein product [Somion occarium]|uniref:Uncharacterized protein n=1 Tax=Somion occarium TaxID=3059160 RepID=A0ABP1DWB0_9APHY